MNTSEFEEHIKGLLEDREYRPDDAAWQKMQQALHPPASRNVLLLFPVWKAAAAVAGLLMLAGSYIWVKKDKPATKDVAVSQQAQDSRQQALPSVAVTTPAAPTITAFNSEKRANTSRTASAAFPIASATVTTFSDDKGIAKNDSQQTVPVVAAHTPEMSHKTSPLQPASPARPDFAAGSYTPDPFGKQHQDKDNSLNMGIAANIGKPSLGNVQYNVGVVIRQDLGSRLFAEASVSLASTNVNYAEKVYGQPGISTGLDGESYMGVAQETTLRYTNNIMAVGFAPSIGVKATRDLSVSVGGDVYKSLNSGLTVQNRTDLNKMTAPPEVSNKGTSSWDAGIRAQLDYKLGSKFSLSTQYRQGLTQFILVDKQSYKNSVFNIGLRYYIGH